MQEGLFNKPTVGPDKSGLPPPGGIEAVSASQQMRQQPQSTPPTVLKQTTKQIPWTYAPTCFVYPPYVNAMWNAMNKHMEVIPTKATVGKPVQSQVPETIAKEVIKPQPIPKQKPITWALDNIQKNIT